MILTYLVTNRVSRDSLYIENLPEDIAIQFTVHPDNRVQITGITFPTQYTYTFSTISQREHIMEMYLNKFLLEIPISNFQRNISFFGPTTVYTKCIDAATFIANELKKLYLNHLIIFYQEEHGTIVAQATSAKDLFEEYNIGYPTLPEEFQTFDVGTEEAVNLRPLLTMLSQFPPEKAGFVEIASEDGGEWLDYIEVNEHYRGMGIGTNLIKLAIRYLDLNCISCVKEAAEYLYSLTELGEALIVSCINKGIVTGDMCYFSTVSKYRSTVDIMEDGEEDNDPGLDSFDVLQALEANHQMNAVIQSISDSNGSNASLPNSLSY